MYTIDFEVLLNVNEKQKDLVTNMIYQFLNTDTQRNGSEAKTTVGYLTIVATLEKYKILVKIEA